MKSNIKNQKAFTLVELLVVISIIGLLSSIVLVSFSNSRDKARLAKAQQFDAQISHALGAYAVGIWRFEEGTGTIVQDSSGYGNDGILGDGTCTPGNGSCPDWTDGVYPETSALEFDGIDDYVKCKNTTNLQVNTGTIEFWFKPDLDQGSGPGWQGGVLAKVGDDANNVEVWLGRDHTPLFLYFLGIENSAISFRIGIGNIVQNNWYHLVGTWNKKGTIIYINGKEKSKSLHDAELDLPESPDVFIGVKNPDASSGIFHYNGIIDGVGVYSYALTAAQIQRHFAEGAERHGIAME